MDFKENAKNYYGKALRNSSDLQTDACCDPTSVPSFTKSALSLIHKEVLKRYYGCGLVAPTKLKDLKILDLGCGTGRDCYLLSYFAGEKGSVIGVDITDEQLKVASQYQEYHRERFGFTKSNVQFVEGDLEKLEELNFERSFFDLIVSNCVLNLVKDKQSVLDAAFSLLKEGGEFYFSDVYATRRVPNHLQEDPILHGECLSGALYWNDFENMAQKSGFSDSRIVESRRLGISNPELKEKLSEIAFYAVTYRLFKISSLERDCEDYGQMVRYNGNLAESPHSFKLDDHHLFEAQKWEPVCGNTYLMLQRSRYRDQFEFRGGFSKHFGIFKGCGKVMPYAEKTKTENPQEGACC